MARNVTGMNAAQGWKRLIAGAPWFRGAGAHPIAAYSEFMPPPRLGRKPWVHAEIDTQLFDADDPWGWNVTEYEETFALQPGLENVAQQVIGSVVHLARGSAAHGISHGKLAGNPYWPPALADHAGSFAHERFVVLLPLALSRTQDDKGRVRWTLFGGSEQGPERAFWKGFFTAPDCEVPDKDALRFFVRLLRDVYGEKLKSGSELRRAGFRILHASRGRKNRTDVTLPSWTKSLAWKADESARSVRYLLTFLPFGELPRAVQTAYLRGDLHLVPFPGSLIYFGVADYNEMARELPLASQIPLLHSIARHEHPCGLRVPQSGWMHEPRANEAAPEARGRNFMNQYKRTHRWARVLRDQDELVLMQREDKLLRVLFSSIPDDIDLYGKPMARNVQLWTDDHRPILDGPNATPEDVRRACEITEAGGVFGYRFVFPAMRVGRHEVYWHRPLAAWMPRGAKHPKLLADAPLGYLTAYRKPKTGTLGIDDPIELWPRILERAEHTAAIRLCATSLEPTQHRPTLEAHKLLDTWHLCGRQPLDPKFARRCLLIGKHKTLEGWIDELPKVAPDRREGARLAQALRSIIAPEAGARSTAAGASIASGTRRAQSVPEGEPPESLTFERTHTRAFEVAYWKTIAGLSEGRYVTQNNADVVLEARSKKSPRRATRDLDRLGDHLLTEHRRAIAAAGMKGRARALAQSFKWRTDFDFSWSASWLANQTAGGVERNIVSVIPGRDRERAIVMADHYDTAYMEDVYAKRAGKKGRRCAAQGADDNHSATAALLLAAPIFLELARRKELACDVWLVHLTGEEFPSDCLGARALCERLVEGTLGPRMRARRSDKSPDVRIDGVYVMDMIAHNKERERDVFQISPGEGSGAMWLARHAHAANEIWNASVPFWNQHPDRRLRKRSPRSPHRVPAIARHRELAGEIRTPTDPRSALFNTDGQIFSDAGIPVVLLMENYDISRSGYHDSHDTLANIDLDYGAALAAIAIESVARAATDAK